MKKFRKLIPALCLLLLSAVLLGGTTFAWFSMNNKVTANNMEVTAKSNTQFLVISASNTLTTERNATVTQQSGGVETGKVYPCARATEDGKPITGIKKGEWYTANSSALDKAGAIGSDEFANAKKIADGDLSNYQITYTFYIGMAAGSDSYTGKITFASLSTSTAFGKGARALIKIGDTEVGTLDSATKDTGKTETVTTASDITLTTTATAVTVILYIDGNDSSVYSNNVTNLTGAINLEVSIVLD